MMGHGEPATGHALLDWQADYIHHVLGAIDSSSRRDGLEGDALADAVTARMKAFLPAEDLLFLTRLSVESLRQRLATNHRGLKPEPGNLKPEA